jgi:nitrogenase-stabilizing/protective protein
VPTSEPLTDGSPTGLASLAGCRDAEDYFRVLGVDYDERVLGPARLHVMRLFGRELAQLGLPTTDPAAEQDDDLPRYRGALERAYAALLDGGPLRHRVFKVLADRAPGQFVPDADVVVETLDPDGGEPR